MRLLASDAAAFSLWCRPLLSFAETKEKVGGGSGRRTEDLCSVCSGEGERELPGDSLRAAEVTSRELRAAPERLSPAAENGELTRLPEDCGVCWRTL